jgi:plastocyanin
LSRRQRLLALAAVVGLALAACSGGGGSPKFSVAGSPVKTNRVDLPKSLVYSPAVIEISAGSTVTWMNDDIFPHTVKLLDGSGTDKPLPIGGSTEITFPKAGTILYLCSLHPQMHGKVIVAP